MPVYKKKFHSCTCLWFPLQKEQFEAEYVAYYLDRADVEVLLSLDEPKKYLKV